MFNTHNSWNDFFNDEMNITLKDIFESINSKVFYPNEKDVLKFAKNDLSKIKYVLYGKDPYVGNTKDNSPIATGRCFEVNNYNDWQQSTRNCSLNNILKALYVYKYNEIKSLKEIKEIIKTNEFILQPHELFDNWENQGILLLNYALTVGETAGSHFEYWHEFSKRLIKYIIDYNPNLKFILWGNDSYNLLNPIINDETKIIKDMHPRTHEFYLKNNTFKKIHDINWLGKEQAK